MNTARSLISKLADDIPESKIGEAIDFLLYLRDKETEEPLLLMEDEETELKKAIAKDERFTLQEAKNQLLDD